MISRKKKRIEEAQARDAMFEKMTDEERTAWTQARLEKGTFMHSIRKLRLEAAFEAAMAEGVLHGQRIAVDVSYQEKMSPLEQTSLVKQLCFCHNANKKATKHISLHVCGIISLHSPYFKLLSNSVQMHFLHLQTPNTNQQLADNGAMNWPATFHEKSMYTFTVPAILTSREEVFDPSELIYLSPDGSEELLTVDPEKVYIIGGFVDRSVNKVGLRV